MRWVLRRGVILIKDSGSVCYPGELTARAAVIAAVTGEAEPENLEAALCSEEWTDRITLKRWTEHCLSYNCCPSNKQILPGYPLLEMNLSCSSHQYSFLLYLKHRISLHVHNLTDNSSTCVQKIYLKIETTNNQALFPASVKLNNALQC